ncbi:MAG: zinc-binding dehydrogenase [Methanobacteriota archaeon]
MNVPPTMRAVLVPRWGERDVLTEGEAATPRPGPGDAVVRVRFCAVNHLDLFVRRGIPALKLPLPHVLGSDVAGNVASVPPGADGVKVGDRVVLDPSVSCGACAYCKGGEESMCDRFGILGEHLWGGNAEFVRVPARNLHRIPPGYDLSKAAAAPITFLTAWRMLATKARVARGETVLVLGAGGGVATAAIQIARHLGARVVATASSEEKLEHARRMGADDVVNHRKEDWGKAVWERTGRRGVDVVVDTVGKDTWPASVRALAKGGRLVTCGNTSGPEVTMDARYVWGRQIEIHGSTMANRREAATVFGLLFTGALEPAVDRVLPLSKVKEAHRILEERGTVGKVVLRVE